MNKRKIALAVAAVGLLAFGVAYAGTTTKLYKWVDKDGVTHYGSSVPPEYASQQSEQLNSHGQVVKTQDAQKTPAQLAAQAQAQQQTQRQAQADAAAKAHDKVLLDTYTSVADIERDRDSKLSAIDAQLTVLNGSINGVENTLAEYQDRANEAAKSDKAVTPKLQKQIDDTKQQLIENQQELLKQQQYKQQMQEQFTKDIARYKELTGQTPATPPTGG
jgi:chromosome segregation ATPase